MLKNLFKKNKSSETTNQHETDFVLRLMFEIAISDGNLDKTELELIKKRANKIAAKNEKVSSIIKKIINETENSTSIYPTVERINAACSKEEKEDLLKVLWELVAADKIINHFEENLYFKIAELIKIKRSQANKIKQENS